MPPKGSGGCATAPREQRKMKLLELKGNCLGLHLHFWKSFNSSFNMTLEGMVCVRSNRILKENQLKATDSREEEDRTCQGWATGNALPQGPGPLPHLWA